MIEPDIAGPTRAFSPGALARMRKALLQHVETAAESRRERGLPEPELLPEEAAPSVIGRAWRAAHWTRLHRERYVGELPRNTGNREDLARRFAGWSSGSRQAILDALRDEGKPIVLNGPPRSGKTSLACWCGLSDELWTAWNLDTDPPRPRLRSYTQLYFRAWDLLSRLKDRMRSEESEPLGVRVRKADFLCIDDLEEAETSWERKTLASIVLDRIGNARRTIVALDQTAEDFERAWPSAFCDSLRTRALVLNMSPYTSPEIGGGMRAAIEI